MRVLAAIAALAIAAPASASIFPGLGFGVSSGRGRGFGLSCPFQSTATCSDSRVVTTTRSTAVPCQQSDGTWGTAAVNTACIAPGGVAGVESYGAVTNYWTDSTSFGTKTATLSPIRTLQGDGSWLMEDDNATNFEGVNQSYAGVAAQTWTISCLAKAGTSSAALLGLSGSDFCAGVPLTASFSRISCTKTLAAAGSAFVYPAGSGAGATGSAYFQQCQVEQSSTPGRRCDSGGTATTCGADQHTVSTTGFPVASGEVEIVYVTATEPRQKRLFDSGLAGGNGIDVFIDASGEPYCSASSGGSRVSTALPSDAAHRDLTAGTHRFVCRWGGGNLSLWHNGSLAATASGVTMPLSHAANAYVGLRSSGAEQVNGTVSLVYIGEPR